MRDNGHLSEQAKDPNEPLYSEARRAEFPPGTTSLEIALTDSLREAERLRLRYKRALRTIAGIPDNVPTLPSASVIAERALRD